MPVCFYYRNSLMRPRDMRHGIYLLPNLLTTASLFAAFYAIVATMQGHIETAVIAIYSGMIADMLDGRIARLTTPKQPRRRIRQSC